MPHIFLKSILGLAEDHPESYHSYMWESFFKHIDILPHNVHIPNGNAKDLVKECEEYEEAIKRVGGVELFIGGKEKGLTWPDLPSMYSGLGIEGGSSYMRLKERVSVLGTL